MTWRTTKPWLAVGISSWWLGYPLLLAGTVLLKA